MDLEDKFIVFEYDSSRVDPGPALILYQARGEELILKYDPREHPCMQLDMGECEAVRDYLSKKKIFEVYTPNTLIMPDSFMGLELDFDNDWEWGSYVSLTRHFWDNFFSKAEIELKFFEF